MAWRTLPGWLLSGLVVLGAQVGTAHAGGFEIPAPGASSLGRAGAYYARADSALALQYNPARLADMPANELLLNVSMPFGSACFQRFGTYGENLVEPDVGRPSRFGRLSEYADEPFPEVCVDRGLQPIPSLLAAVPVVPGELGLGFGLVTPLGLGNGVWEDDDHAVRGVNGDRRPSPVRYLFARPDSLVLYLGLGAGYRILPELSLGATLLLGYGQTSTTTYSVLIGGEDPAIDVRSTIDAKDYFIPGGILTLTATPVPGFDITLGARYIDDVEVEGDTTLVYGDFATETPVPGGTVPTKSLLRGTVAGSPQPPRVWLGLRYGALREGALPDPAEGRDPMRDELWDLELDVVYEMNSAVDQLTLDVPDDATLNTVSVDENGDRFPASAPIGDRPIDKHWRDQVTLHLGGDVNVVPDQLALRAGASFETNGVDVRYLNVDFFPGQRLGLHLGGTVRAAGFDISLAYAHLFQWTLDNDAPGSGTADEAMFRQPVSESLRNTAKVVNHGRLKASFDVVSLGLAYRF